MGNQGHAEEGGIDQRMVADGILGPFERSIVGRTDLFASGNLEAWRGRLGACERRLESMVGGRTIDHT